MWTCRQIVKPEDGDSRVSETVVSPYKSTCHQNPEDKHLHCHENLRSHAGVFINFNSNVNSHMTQIKKNVVTSVIV
jgi:hypothetical protein